jgi:hypothetical protein
MKMESGVYHADQKAPPVPSTVAIACARTAPAQEQGNYPAQQAQAGKFRQTNNSNLTQDRFCL